MLGGSVEERLRRICARANDLPTIAAAGGVSSGKSTLVNALVGRRVAPTDAGECTQLVARFRFGRPEQITIHLRDGGIRSARFDDTGQIPSRLGLPNEDVDHLEVHLSVHRLRVMELVDTPGVASGSAAAPRTERYLGFDDRSREEVGQADAVIYMLTPTGRMYEERDLAAFGTGAGGRSDAAVGVLAKADLVAGGDPVAAADLAARLAADLRAHLNTVLPVWTLVAETVACGRLHEADAATAATVADLEEATREILLASADLFSTYDVQVPSESRRRLEDLLAHAGTARAVRAATDGIRGAADLSRFLDELSGRRALDEAIDALAARADVLRAARMLHDAEQAGWEFGPPGATLRDLVEDLRARPELHVIEEISALDELAAGRLRLSEEDAAQARDVLTQRPLNGLALESLIDRWRELENLTPDPQAARFARTIIRSLSIRRSRVDA